MKSTSDSPERQKKARKIGGEIERENEGKRKIALKRK